MANLVQNLPGAEPASFGTLNDILKGAVIWGFEPEKARDPDHGGEVVRMNLVGGDYLLLFAVPNVSILADVNAPTALLQPVLVHRRGTRLKV